MPFADVRTTSGEPHRLYYRVFPEGDGCSGRPLVIMILGLGGVHQAWALQVERLMRSCRVCVFDNRGLGYSVAPSCGAPWTTAELARDVLQLLDALGWHDHVHVVGISLGGMIAQELAVASPERLASLTLLCTGPGQTPGTETPEQTNNDFWRSVGIEGDDSAKERTALGLPLNYSPEWLRSDRISDLHDGRTVTNERWLRKFLVLQNSSVPPDLQAAGHGHSGLPSPISLLKQAEGARTHHLTYERSAAFRGLDIPAVVIAAELDCVFPPTAAPELVSVLGPTCRLSVLKGCGHTCIHQMPDEVSALIEANISEGERRLPHASPLSAAPGRLAAKL
eukprot:NODE_1097_length_1241_cov_271.584317.p1 GENE.NODE_1097_length_1241_cov_271.584317~~NODE_1097_length_1241_cov_271.584317.p1  ORF type:complete len:337 (-),score=60.45 NODE_1097_length_1241_cov_271.584317:75-1085(-)